MTLIALTGLSVALLLALSSLKKGNDVPIVENSSMQYIYVPPPEAAPYLSVAYETEQREGIPRNLLVKLLETESNFNPNALNVSSNAQGIAQIVPRWHPNVDPYNADEAIPYAGHYLRTLYEQFGDWRKALAGYNWGPGNLQKALNEHGFDWISVAPRETREYIDKISTGVIT